jgi:Fe-S cluster assembly scaffold protein SufB
MTKGLTKEEANNILIEGFLKEIIWIEKILKC